MKKSVLISVFLLTISLLVMAQTKMFLYFNDGTTYETIATNVDSIVFIPENTSDENKPNANGHEYVDLGLPSGLLWATCNVGAENPEDYGYYFAWGETQPKIKYVDETYKWGNVSNHELTKYCTNSNYGTVDNKTIIELSDDAANVNWGGTWRMPTKDELDELRNNCEWIKDTINFVCGYKVIGPNGNSIFLPFAGRYDYYPWSDGEGLQKVNQRGEYWSSSIKMDIYAYDLRIDLYGVDENWDECSREMGKTVRAVLPESLNYTITFNSNVEGNVTSTLQTIIYAEQLSFPPNSFVYEGYEFIGWNTKADGSGTSYAEGTDITISSDLTLYAQWEKIPTINANGHEYVDLGLPSGLLWATCNVGAENPEDYGYYFAWGETQPKSADSWNTNSWNNYKWCKGTRETQTKYCTDLAYGTVDNKTILELSDDAAYVNWGGNWRMPTKDEQKELYTECIWKWTNVDGINGYNVTGPNGKRIFLPATSGSSGVYWTSSLSTRYSYDAYYMTLGPSNVYWTDFGRYNVHSVRPVMSVEFNYNVTFDSNGGEGNMQVISINRAEQITIPENKFTNIGYEFICWNTKPDGTGTSYMKGENIIISSNITLYAQWQAISGSSNGYSYVDLGLPSGILWATINVGANSPEQYGYYFAWGETEPKSTYNWETYKWCNGSQKTQTKYCIDSSNGTVDNKTILELSDDAANVNWGGEWRIPTKEEQDELRTKCSWEWTTRNGVNGYIVTGPNSNSIFLPASGYRRDSNLNELTSYGVYWSNSLDINNSSYGHDLYFDINRIDATTYSRYFGLTVRPVLSADKD